MEAGFALGVYYAAYSNVSEESRDQYIAEIRQKIYMLGEEFIKQSARAFWSHYFQKQQDASLMPDEKEIIGKVLEFLEKLHPELYQVE